MYRTPRRAEILAYTTCRPFVGARVTIPPGLRDDSLPVAVHEGVHADQCDRLGAMRYALRNLTDKGKLSLEAPAYCAAAAERIRLGIDSASVRTRLRDDVVAGLADAVPSGRALAAIEAECPDIARKR